MTFVSKTDGLIRMVGKVDYFDGKTGRIYLDRKEGSTIEWVLLEGCKHSYICGELYEFWLKQSSVKDELIIVYDVLLTLQEYMLIKGVLELRDQYLGQPNKVAKHEDCKGMMNKTYLSREKGDFPVGDAIAYFAMMSVLSDKTLFLDTDVLINGKEHEIARMILHLVQEFLIIWTDLKPNDIHVQRITTALSNIVFVIKSNVQVAPLVSSEKGQISLEEPEKLLLRVYGTESWMFERPREEAISMTLAKEGLIPKWYGVFGNGRFEEYIAHVPITAEGFRQNDISKNIIQRLASIHLVTESLSKHTSISIENQLWERLCKWSLRAEQAFGILLEQQKELTDNNRELLNIINGWGVFDKEKKKKLVKRAFETNSMLVFAHCDLHHGNVLRTLSSEDDYMIIDFEYGMVTARGFDLANFLWEHCTNYDSDKPEAADSTKFPDGEYLDALLTSYLEAFHDNNTSNVKIELDLELASLKLEIESYLPLVHLHWALWGLVKATETEMYQTFDYLQYSYERFLRIFPQTRSIA